MLFLMHLLMQMSEHYWAPQSNVSNETSTAKTFQRTISAQVCVCQSWEMAWSLVYFPSHFSVSSYSFSSFAIFHCTSCHSYLANLYLVAVSVEINPYNYLVSSLQDTLAYATALLNEKDQSGSSNGSESSPANENGDRHLQQVINN